MTYRIAIPSYKRANTLKQKTLTTLLNNKIDPELVDIFVANEEEYDTYQKTLTDTPFKNNICIGKPGLSAVRNHIRFHYKEGTNLVHLDDDLMQILHRVDEKKLAPVPNLEKDVFLRGFDNLKEHDAYLWGIYAASNPFFMKKDVSVGLYYIIGSCWGNIVRHDKDLLLTLEDKEDFERTLQYYVKDGRVIRLDNITVKSLYYTEPGGMQETRTSERITKSAENLAERYPDLCTMYIRKTTGHAELRLRDTREKASGNTLDSFFGD